MIVSGAVLEDDSGGAIWGGFGDGCDGCAMVQGKGAWDFFGGPRGIPVFPGYSRTLPDQNGNTKIQHIDPENPLYIYRHTLLYYYLYIVFPVFPVFPY